MRKWKVNAAGPTKAAVEWLVVRIREARPDLWGRRVSPEVLDEQKDKVVREALIWMEGLVSTNRGLHTKIFTVFDFFYLSSVADRCAHTQHQAMLACTDLLLLFL